jgi:acyl-coenzyme A thioesterase PaaI-like protein
MASLIVARRFNGPASSGNGGYTAGALAEAAQIPGPVAVNLRRPPPLDELLDVVPTDDGVELRHGGELVAMAVPSSPAEWTDTEPVAADVAAGLERTFAGFRSHPFPRCFSCGPERAPGDGLRIFPGRLDDGRVAATWTPDPSVARADGVVQVPVTWAALDCVGGWSSDLDDRPVVLGSITARVVEAPRVGTPYTLVGTLRDVEGRKTWTASSMFDPDGRLVARAEHLWIVVDRTVVQQMQRVPRREVALG